MRRMRSRMEAAPVFGAGVYSCSRGLEQMRHKYRSLDRCPTG